MVRIWLSGRMLAYQVQGWGSSPNTGMGGQSLLSSRATLDSSWAGINSQAIFHPTLICCTFWGSPKHLLYLTLLPKNFPKEISTFCVRIEGINYPLCSSAPIGLSRWENSTLLPTERAQNLPRTELHTVTLEKVCQGLEGKTLPLFQTRLTPQVSTLMRQELSWAHCFSLLKRP